MATWLRDTDLKILGRPNGQRLTASPVYATSLGAAFHGPSERLLKNKALQARYKGKVQLIFTSPPFPLNEKKKYGNLTGEEYVRWLARFAPLLRDYLTPTGSIAMEIGNAWLPGHRVMSTDTIKGLLRFLEKGKLHLCQEFVWYNPARLPSPVQWVNVERIRVKDAFTRIWWMSPTERPKADNRRILQEYSSSMEKLIASGHYNAGIRPSAHRIGAASFTKHNGGAIPPNVIGDDQTPISLIKAAKNSQRTITNVSAENVEYPFIPRACQTYWLNFLCVS
jgi:hypothetical protein